MFFRDLKSKSLNKKGADDTLLSNFRNSDIAGPCYTLIHRLA